MVFRPIKFQIFYRQMTSPVVVNKSLIDTGDDFEVAELATSLLEANRAHGATHVRAYHFDQLLAVAST